jgi:polyisoprenoid-binding protein YceI
MTIRLISAALFALAACAPPTQPASPAPAAAIAPISTEAPAGAYVIDPSHTSVLLRADHLSFSMFTSRFTDVHADLQLDPANPAAAQLSVTIAASSWTSDGAPADFLAIMLGPKFLDAAAHPQITFRSTAIELTGPDAARVTGDLTLRGITRPIVLETTFNGGYVGHAYEPNARIGFSATGRIKRSEFGMDFGLPPPGSTMGVGDDIEIIVETEFTGPPLANPPPAPPPVEP